MNIWLHNKKTLDQIKQTWNRAVLMDISSVNYHLIEILGNVKDLSDIHYVVDGEIKLFPAQ